MNRVKSITVKVSYSSGYHTYSEEWNIEREIFMSLPPPTDNEELRMHTRIGTVFALRYDENTEEKLKLGLRKSAIEDFEKTYARDFLAHLPRNEKIIHDKLCGWVRINIQQMNSVGLTFRYIEEDDEECDFCGKVIRDFNSENKLYEVGIAPCWLARGGVTRFEVCTECKNKVLSLRKVEANENERI